MKRSDTYARVFETADRLLESGTRPTQQNVREALGTGSATTIHKALGDWWKHLGERLSEHKHQPGLPSEVVRAADELWRLAVRQANSALEESRLRIQEQARQLQQSRQEEREAAQKDVLEANQLLKNTYAQIETLTREAQRASQELFACEKSLLEERQIRQNLERENKELKLIYEKQGELEGRAEVAAVADSDKALLACQQQLEAQQQETRQAQRECRNLELTISQLDAKYQHQKERLEHTQAELFESKKQQARLSSELQHARLELTACQKNSSQDADIKRELDTAKTLLQAKVEEVERLMKLLTKP